MNKHITLLLTVFALFCTSACSSLPSWMGGMTTEKPKLEGERLVALPIESKLKPDASLANVPPTLPPVVPNAEWAQNASSFSAATGNLSGGLFEQKISASAGEGVKFLHTIAPHPVVAGGAVFAMDAAGNISAHDAGDISKIKWKSPAVADIDGHDVIGGGLAVAGSVLYATTGQGAIAALETATGKLLWRKDFGIPLRASPRANGNIVIVVTIDSQTYALSAKTGETIWEHRGINETAGVMNNVSPTIAGDGVLVPYSSGELFALSLENGKELWSETLLKNKSTEAYGVFSGIGGDPVVDGQAVFASSNNGVTAAINLAQGQRIWQQQVGSFNSPWLAGDELFVLSTDNILLDIMKYNGKIRWATKLTSYEDTDRKLNPISWRGPILVNGKLLAISSNGQAVLVNAVSGKISNTLSIPEKITTAPIVAGGRVYLLGNDATLYSFGG
jgi:outer membrane protein assembly factor BamB